VFLRRFNAPTRDHEIIPYEPSSHRKDVPP
jgi:hypothetical protein